LRAPQASYYRLYASVGPIFFWSNESEKFSGISLLFTLFFSIFLVIGALCMVFATFSLGAVLFSVGMGLMAGNDYLAFKRLKGNIYSPDARTPSKFIDDLFNFAILACVLPSTASVSLYLFADMGEQVLVIVLASFILISIKVVSCSLQFYFSK
jgi:hypothetical protein